MIQYNNGITSSIVCDKIRVFPISIGLLLFGRCCALHSQPDGFCFYECVCCHSFIFRAISTIDSLRVIASACSTIHTLWSKRNGKSEKAGTQTKFFFRLPVCYSCVCVCRCCCYFFLFVLLESRRELEQRRHTWDGERAGEGAM